MNAHTLKNCLVVLAFGMTLAAAVAKWNGHARPTNVSANVLLAQYEWQGFRRVPAVHGVR